MEIGAGSTAEGSGSGEPAPSRGTHQRGRTLALAADGLTFARGTIAVALIPLLASGRVSAGAALVGLAWTSDFLDGRAARASGSPTRLGSWDLAADTAVGAGIVLGFGASGWFAWWIGVALAALLGGAFVISRIEALSMMLQATGYAMLLWRTWTDQLQLAFGWLVAVAAVIGLVNRRVFWERSLPTFLGGVGAVFRRRGRT